MKKRIITVCILVICMVTFSGCAMEEVIQDILSVNEAEIYKDKGPKVSISRPAEQPKVTETPKTPEDTETPMPTPTEEPKNMIYCISPVNVRGDSSNEAQIIGALAPGEAVEMLGKERSWIKINYEGQEGWVYEKYVTGQEAVSVEGNY